ncbi:MAG: SRPBCC family protein [Polyangiaceae bacterium]
MASTTDRIEKTVLLRAPVERVWRAVSDAREFGAWFGVAFEGPFVAGAPLHGRIVPTQVDPEVAELQKPHEGASFEIVVDRIERPRLFSFRWHPFAIDPGHDYSAEPMTLVVFALEPAAPAAERTRLTITESGFDAIPLSRRAAAFTANEDGWAHQARLVEKYVSRG